MTTEKIIKGLQILQPYSKTPYAVAAEHDQIFFGVDVDVSESDKATLIELGWFNDEELSWSAWV